MVTNYDISASISVPAFSDSVDFNGGYTIGICGEKTFTFDFSYPFLTVILGTDPIINSLTIYYDHLLATESDIGLFYIPYTIKMAEYDGIVSDLSGSFSYQLLCPSTYTEDGFIGGTTVFNLVS